MRPVVFCLIALLAIASFSATAAAQQRRLLYAAVPGIRNYLEYGGHGLLVFDIDNGNGLSGILSGREAHNVIHNVRDLPSLFVMPVGTVPPNPLELVERPAFNLLMRELLNKFDHIVVDTPAAVHGSDAGVIAAKCGAAIVIARKDRTRAAMLQEFVGLLGQSPARLGGVVMNEY